MLPAKKRPALPRRHDQQNAETLRCIWARAAGIRVQSLPPKQEVIEDFLNFATSSQIHREDIAGEMAQGLGDQWP